MAAEAPSPAAGDPEGRPADDPDESHAAGDEPAPTRDEGDLARAEGPDLGHAAGAIMAVVAAGRDDDAPSDTSVPLNGIGGPAADVLGPSHAPGDAPEAVDETAEATSAEAGTEGGDATSVVGDVTTLDATDADAAVPTDPGGNPDDSRGPSLASPEAPTVVASGMLPVEGPPTPSAGVFFEDLPGELAAAVRAEVSPVEGEAESGTDAPQDAGDAASSGDVDGSWVAGEVPDAAPGNDAAFEDAPDASA
jgi:hypothetical protein